DGLENGSICILDRDPFGEPIQRHRLDSFESLTNDHLETCLKFLFRSFTARFELGVTVADIRLAKHAGADPLTDVAAEMQNQIPDGVLVFRAAHPDLLFG